MQREAPRNFSVFSRKMHEKYRFFPLYVVQKSTKFFLYEPKKICKLQKNTAPENKSLRKSYYDKIYLEIELMSH